MPVFRAKDGILKLPDSSEEWTEEFTFIQAADCQLGLEWVMIESGRDIANTDWNNQQLTMRDSPQ